MPRTLYTTRSAANRAARNAAKALYGKSFEAFEGSDYGIYPDTVRDENYMPRSRYYFELRGA